MPTLFTMNADIGVFDSRGYRGADGLRFKFELIGLTDNVIRVLDSPRPALLGVSPVYGYVRSDGRMYDRPAISAAPYDLNDPGELGVRLLADDSNVQLDFPITYRVSLLQLRNGIPVVLNDLVTGPVPVSDTTVDLASLII